MEEAEQNEVQESKDGMEDDNIGAAVDIKKLGDESTDSEDEDMSEEDTSEDEEILKDDDGNDEEPNGITLYSESTH